MRRFVSALARLALAASSLSFTPMCEAEAAPAPPQDCRVGFYRLQDGTGIDVGNTSSASLRWRRADGTSGALHGEPGKELTSTLGWTDRADGHRISFGDCAQGKIVVDGVTGRRVQFSIRESQFQNAGATLAGRLILPSGSRRVPIVVLVHGSEDSSALRYFALQRQFPAEGIGAFVYDKRGTGKSTGTFTHNYYQLASDAAAAVREARRLAGDRAGKTGMHGSSQGGWVAPLAADLTPVDFVVVAYGLAISPFDEDNEVVALDMTRHGFGAPEIAKALEVARAAQDVALSYFQYGYEALDAVRAKYAGEPWLPYLRGNITQVVLTQPREWLRTEGPKFFAGGMPYYDPMPVLRRLDVPQLWILGADDIDAPVAETVRRLTSLMPDRRPIKLVVYPRAEHGLYEYEVDATGERQSLRQPATYLPLMCDFIRAGRIGKQYGDSAIHR